MNTSLRIAIFVALVFYFICIFYLLRKKSINLKYTLLWIFSGIVMCLIALFPDTFAWLMHKLGIIEMTNGLFAFLFFAIIILLMSLTSIVSKMNNNMRQLVQQCAMYEKRIRELEKIVKEGQNQK